MMKKHVLIAMGLIWLDVACSQVGNEGSGRMVSSGKDPAEAQVIQFIYTSDLHYGKSRQQFRGAKDVDARVVNAAMVARMNELPGAILPDDDGLRAGEPVGPIALVIETGDIGNRQEGTGETAIQRSAISWAQFKEDFIEGLQVRDGDGQLAGLLLAPGNHDVTNAIGDYEPMTPARDATCLAEIFNRMVNPAVPRTKDTYDYATDKVHTSRNVAGIHLIFLNLWSDSGERAWMESDLRKVSAGTPVMLFAHDPPAVDARHFINPNGDHSINPTDRFENVLGDQLADGLTVEDSTAIEQRDFARFLKKHKNIRAYFHGHDNYNEFYRWEGPDRDVDLQAFRVDSPIKGEHTEDDETRLSFQLVTIDTTTLRMTVRECLWNKTGQRVSAPNDDQPVAWGSSTTVSLANEP